jgi:phosphoribosylanthranilate isomerase
MTKVKICGITELESGVEAIDTGADYLGFVFYPPSSRYLDTVTAGQLIGELRAARPHGWMAVGVFVNEPIELVEDTRYNCRLDVVQLNGEEPPTYARTLRPPVFKAVRAPVIEGDSQPEVNGLPSAEDCGAERILLDANVPGRYGGTGVSYDWSRFRRAVADGFLAGGLTPDNVEQAIRAARPWGVDVSSGVEHQGRKSAELIRRFISTVRGVQP